MITCDHCAANPCECPWSAAALDKIGALEERLAIEENTVTSLALMVRDEVRAKHTVELVANGAMDKFEEFEARIKSLERTVAGLGDERDDALDRTSNAEHDLEHANSRIAMLSQSIKDMDTERAANEGAVS